MVNNLSSPYTGVSNIKPSDMKTNIPQNINTDDPQQLMEVCREFESIFINLILKQARSGINVGEVTEKSHAREIFEEMHDEQMAVNMSKGQGIGLAQQLYRQLTRSSIRPPNIKNHEETIDKVDEQGEIVDKTLD